MTLRAATATSTPALWRGFVDAFLADLGDRPGPGGFPAFAWLTHRLQRDLLWKAAADRGLRGWLQPPHGFFSELPRMFAIDLRRIGLLERQVLLDELSARVASETGFDIGASSALGPRGLGRAVDQLLGELLPEGVDPDQLAAALAGLPGQDDFCSRRNRWLPEVCRRYAAALAARKAYDPRAIHSLVADRITAGGLGPAIRGARRLHLYGLTTARSRRKLLQALAAEPGVDAVVYLLGPAPGAEWAGLVQDATVLPGDPAPPPEVQPAPDEQRELEHVALEIKRLARGRPVPLDEIAVVARTGREDARFAHELLERAGIPTTARIRTPLDQVPALTAVLQLLRASALRWRYRPLRHVLESSYFRLDIDLRPIDHLATRRRILGLDEWLAALRRLEERVARNGEDDPELRSFRAERLARTVAAFAAFAEQAERLAADRSLAGWIALTLELLEPGWFELRQRVCRPDGGRHDLVRLDQQGIQAAQRLLRQWSGPEEPALLTGLEWHQRLRRLLAANELTLATPRRTGVQVIEAHEAALIPFQRVFLIHANEGEFPKRQPPGGILTDPERLELAAAGLPVAHRDLTLARERLLWRAVTSTPAVTITYRTADPMGVPLLPSLLAPEHDVRREIPRTRFVWDDPFAPHHADRTAVQRLRDLAERAPDPSAPLALETPDPEPVRLAILRAVAETHRLGHTGTRREAGLLGPWTGELRDPAVLARLAERFGPDRIWSATQLEGWCQNPFVFLLQRVLYLEEKIEAEDDVTALVRGGVAHALLERFVAAVQHELPAPFDRFRDRFEEIAGQVFSELERDETAWLGLPHLWRVKRDAIRRMVAEYLAWDFDDLAPWKPAHLEHAFGDEGQEPLVVAGRARTGGRGGLRLRGRIDRIDIRADGGRTVHRILDYKSGALPQPKGYRDGAVLQAPLYLAALAAAGFEVELAEYRSIKERKRSAMVAPGDEDYELALSFGLAVPGLVRQGRFEPRAAQSTGWRSYWPGGLALYRVEAVLSGARFE